MKYWSPPRQNYAVSFEENIGKEDKQETKGEVANTEVPSLQDTAQQATEKTKQTGSTGSTNDCMYFIFVSLVFAIMLAMIYGIRIFASDSWQC